MTPNELASKKIALALRLEAIGMTNIYGSSMEERISLETARIETERELHEISAKIRNYIEKGAA